MKGRALDEVSVLLWTHHYTDAFISEGVSVVGGITASHHHLHIVGHQVLR